MKPMRSCKEITHLALQALDRPLGLRERMAVRMHLWICRYCPAFMRQVALMQKANERWRRYTEE